MSAVLLAVELLLFEYRARSLIPVALASVAACRARIAFVGTEHAFAMPPISAVRGGALVAYVVMGALLGLCAMLITRAVYAVEDGFEKLPYLHWMWWPAIGGLAVGIIGYVAPRTMGVGYDNIDHLLSGELFGPAALVFCALKMISWSLSLGSGTSGGTLAPLFTIGGGIGSIMGTAAVWMLPRAGIDIRVAALVGMAALFAGASRARLTSVVFAFETTREPAALLPLLGACTASYLVSALTMRHSIMTEKIARRGTRIVTEYASDYLAGVQVSDVASTNVAVLQATDTLDQVRAWLAERGDRASHQGFPVVDAQARIVGVVTRRDLLQAEARRQTGTLGDLITRPPAVVYEDTSLREAADHMVQEGVGRLPVVARRREPRGRHPHP